MQDIDKALHIMELTAINTGRMLLDLQPKSQRLSSYKDFLADADIKSENMILSALMSEYPTIPFLSEEKWWVEFKEWDLWIIDPLDWTINFFLQDYNWWISIALVRDWQTIAWVVYLPAWKSIFVASSGTIAKFRNVDEKGYKWKELKVRQEYELANTQFWFGWGKEWNWGKDHQRTLDLISIVDRYTLYPQIRNSAVGDMMAVALGKIDGYILPKPESFDMAAWGLIIQRAGGRVTDIDGGLWSPFSRSLVATNGAAHDKLLSILATYPGTSNSI